MFTEALGLLQFELDCLDYPHVEAASADVEYDHAAIAQLTGRRTEHRSCSWHAAIGVHGGVGQRIVAAVCADRLAGRSPTAGSMSRSRSEPLRAATSAAARQANATTESTSSTVRFPPAAPTARITTTGPGAPRRAGAGPASLRCTDTDWTAARACGTSDKLKLTLMGLPGVGDDGVNPVRRLPPGHVRQKERNSLVVQPPSCLPRPLDAEAGGPALEPATQEAEMAVEIGGLLQHPAACRSSSRRPPRPRPRSGCRRTCLPRSPIRPSPRCRCRLPAGRRTRPAKTSPDVPIWKTAAESAPNQRETSSNPL